MPPQNLTVICVTAIVSLACYAQAERNRYATTIAEAMRLVRNWYVEDVEPHQLFENAMNGMVEGLDQYSAYIGPDSYKQMEASLDQEFGGVGIEVEKPSDSEPLIVLSPLVGTPAYHAGMRAGDQVLQIEGVSTLGMSLKDAVKQMRGKPGSQVRLLVLHAGDGDPIEMKITREVIVVDSVLGDTRREDGSWEYHLQENRRIGYLRITTFGKHTVDELSRTLSDRGGESEGFEAMILDLRGNAGGLLDAAVETCDLFLDQGRIVSTRGRDGQVRSTYSATSSTAIAKDIPMAVLVNRFSASASEIVAACLQDHGRAVVVGERTWGKGTVQNILELEGGRSALKLTTASYWRPSGKNIHRRKDAGEDRDWGVQPNKGFEAILTDGEAEKILLQRQKRDIRRDAHETATSPETSGDTDEQTGGTEDAEPFDDPQLRKAIQYIERQLKRIDSQSQTAWAVPSSFTAPADQVACRNSNGPSPIPVSRPCREAADSRQNARRSGTAPFCTRSSA